MEDTRKLPLCCFFLSRGSCTHPAHLGGVCPFLHIPDDGVSPCSYGPTCKKGHAKRVSLGDLAAQREFWERYRANGVYEGASPAKRNATTLRAQLEPHPTAVLRARLTGDFHLPAVEASTLGRAEVMARLLAEYAARPPRRVVKVAGTPVRPFLLEALLAELKVWEASHTINTRPSIAATNYMILRSPAEFSKKDSKNASQAAAKIAQWQALWDLASTAIVEADPEFARSFTALAVTCGFSGSPHIDKQNTGPFYGLALGDFPAGEGALCVECDAMTVGSVDTKNCLGKVDGRYPHWVAPYKEGTKRYSLIYYQTEGAHVPPGAPFFGKVLGEEE